MWGPERSAIMETFSPHYAACPHWIGTKSKWQHRHSALRIQWKKNESNCKMPGMHCTWWPRLRWSCWARHFHVKFVPGPMPVLHHYVSLVFLLFIFSLSLSLQLLWPNHLTKSSQKEVISSGTPTPSRRAVARFVWWPGLQIKVGTTVLWHGVMARVHLRSFHNQKYIVKTCKTIKTHNDTRWFKINVDYQNGCSIFLKWTSHAHIANAWR